MQVFSVFIVCLGIVFFSPTLNEKNDGDFLSLRTPASKELNCLELIRDFYPSQSEDFLKERIRLNKDVHSMYRAFVPLYYKEFFDHPKRMKAMGDLNKFIATISGDAHFENFGFIIDEAGVVRFSINDIDDSTRGPLYFDVYRLFISSHFLDKNIEWEDFLAAYKEGVKKEKREFTNVVHERMAEAKSLRDDVLKSYVSSTPPYRFIKLKTPNRKMSSEEEKNVLLAMKKIFPEIKIHDQYVRIKTDGGSAGMLRFSVLASLTPDTPVRWLDIKETGMSSMDKVFNAQKAPPFDDRLSFVKRDIYQSSMDHSLLSLKINDSTFSLRYMDQFAVGVSAKDVEKDQLINVALDEAYALGRFHAQSLASVGKTSNSYLAAWEQVDTKDAKEIADDIHDFFKDLFKSGQ